MSGVRANFGNGRTGTPFSPIIGNIKTPIKL
jgi:hypothetical protein